MLGEGILSFLSGLDLFVVRVFLQISLNLGVVGLLPINLRSFGLLLEKFNLSLVLLVDEVGSLNPCP